MNLNDAMSAFGWAVIIGSLAIAAVFSVLAYHRPRPPYLYIAGGAVVVALVGASTAQADVPPVAAPLIALLGMTVAVFGGSPAAATALQLAMGGSAAPGAHGGILVAVRSDEPREPGIAAPRREVLRGGLTIGILERVGAAGSIIAGFPEGLAIVVAIKGVGRFTELEAPEARERFIIGTFASLIWACAAALTVHMAIR
ncbi:hypothetical protein BCL57_003483 [Agromyces flavus]|uniref:Uncharacterized protein n=1 Tax=Agromyces flavus TaxID=589382 RepID=A0A1H1STW5_9MICO|nr:hypothetical protein [Agromyces flavus]MCP2369297.1 hypothetical protein [Agromyces flavus]GGI48729.1 hypothetical protein GCM10010932_34170 [Agromyces flavus]SDS51422.1 hypothetical protein SAMN04489721_1448 [Agromyces flavus]